MTSLRFFSSSWAADILSTSDAEPFQGAREGVRSSEGSAADSPSSFALLSFQSSVAEVFQIYAVRGSLPTRSVNQVSVGGDDDAIQTITHRKLETRLTNRKHSNRKQSNVLSKTSSRWNHRRLA
jgi:hypothetical protein